VKRLAVVSSTDVEPHRHADGGFLLNRIMQPMVAKTIGKRTYADMRAMEAILRDSILDWTVIRSAGLFDVDHLSDYQVSDGPLDGIFTSRTDLADLLLAQASDTTYAGKAIEITTTEGANPVADDPPRGVQTRIGFRALFERRRDPVFLEGVRHNVRAVVKLLTGQPAGLETRTAHQR
jgi:NAD(P)H-binding